MATAWITLKSGATLGLALVLLATALTVAACAGGSGAEPGPGAPGPGMGAGMGPGISVAEALVSRLEGPLLVRGWLWRAEGGELHLCAELTDSIPPQCRKPWFTVKGLDLSKVEGLRAEGGVTWSPQPVLVLGDVMRGVLEVSGLSRG
ncbi:MAG: hypothetical protein EXR54_01250 [Dehalococcoidia bacterium]|nr:hypothetical protein [Dehalococcoidia bacterium]MSQ16185.1 hypothetical protein [Dehalococcoidia bacterium]